MKIKKYVVLLAVFLVTFSVGCAFASEFYLNFENGVDGTGVTNISGVSLSNYNGYAPLYLDGSTGSYNVSDINGAYNYGSYYISGNIGVWAGPEADARGVKIDFENNDGTWFKTGYCSNSTFYLDAYLTDGTKVTVFGGNNFGTGMDYLTVSSNSSGVYIDYVVLHDTGNYWVVDNMSGNTSGVRPVPLPPAVLLFGSGLLGLAAKRFRENKV